jgi:putative glutamine amidotransferase
VALPVIGITGSVDRSGRLSSAPLIAVGGSYVRAVELAGGAPVVTPPHPDEGVLRAIFERLDGLILSGGGDVLPALYGEPDSGLLWSVNAERDRAELLLARWALAEHLPLLGICRGNQVLNVAAGGTLVQDIATYVPEALDHSSVASRPMDCVAHSVEIREGSRLAALFGAGALHVNSAHHQAVLRVGAPLVVTAVAADGVSEGVEAPEHPFCLGVQWHPEALLDTLPQMRRLFEALIEAARATRP